MTLRLLLASGSPRRAQLLRASGYEFEIDAPDVDETPLPDENPSAMVRRLAEAKAAAVAARNGPETGVLACDTTVVLAGEILGKPRDDADGVAMLLRIGGRQHEVISGYALLADGRVSVGTEVSVVEMTAIDRNAAQEYVATGEPLDKAGSYAIQGIGRRFVAGYEGSFSNIMGPPMEAVVPLLDARGIRPVRIPEPLPT